MKLAERIFRRNDFYVTSAFGYRKDPINGKTSFHSGCDYGTHVEKWAQYALEDGNIINCGTASDGAKYVWVKYPRLNIKLLHYHLDSISVKTGQSVNKDTIIGYTGKTGRATGIHLHLGMKYLNSDSYTNPDTYNYEEYFEPSVQGDIDELARKVINGDFGSGEDRKRLLGNIYSQVQQRVNEILAGKPSMPEKSIEELAKEVIDGKYGNGEDRKKALGDKYQAVQSKVNEILYGNKKSIDEIAREVINGNWGNGQERKDRLAKSGYNYQEVQNRVNQILYN